MRAQVPTPHPKRRAVAALGLLALTAGGPAAAQGLDYGALEALFEEPVTTSATGKPQRASEVPVAMDIITAEQIRRSGAHDIPTVLARYTSLDVLQYNEQDFSVSARGLATPSNPRLLVLIDGRQVYLDDYGRTKWAALPVQLGEIRQIEVVRGPNTALFGFNAVAGVVNIVTYNPAFDRVSNATVRLGTHGYREASGVATAPLGEGSGVRLSAGVRDASPWRSGFLPGEAGKAYQQDPERFQFATNTVARITDHIQASFDASYSRTRETAIDIGALNYSDTRTWSLRGRITAETGIGLVEGAVYHNGVESDLYRSLHFDQGVTVVQLSDTLKLGARHTLRPSFEYRHNALHIGTAQVGYDVVAIGAMWNWAILDTLELTLAGRRDQVWLEGSGYNSAADPNRNSLYNNRDFGTFAYNAGLVWRPSPTDTVRLSAARGIGMPSLIDLGALTSIGPFLIVGNPNLRPTIVDNYEIGYRRHVAALDASLGITVFHQSNRDISSSFGAPWTMNPGVSGLVKTPQNLPKLEVSGIELSGKGKLAHGFDWGIEYRLASVAGSLDPTVQLDPKHASPRHLVSGRLGWGSGPFQADAFLRYASTASGWRFVNSTATYVTVDDYASVGARLAYRLNDRLTLAAEGSNLVTEKQRQSIGLQARRSLYLSLRAEF
ncbi:TonB-dependent receptor plug domain-containing protein [Paracraurococcus lichenis]|uniref:TonB-dependent receptor n=1 Tax=Paracraurococcus lichenis TaxID=3064888 RepID=A0ABT9EA78_9PROT|nr:TonB-dependent receptor [Paracraurococcus sp. LOR1-02]MDO9713074.1 TonB-dependent receptor [Paracraurococcus sp. LOR1-02]